MKIKLKIFGCDLELTGGACVAVPLFLAAAILFITALVLKHWQ